MNAIKSEASRKTYNFYLNKFLKWSKIKEPNGLLQLKESFLQEVLEDYLFDLKKKNTNPNSFNLHFAPIELFLIMNDKMVNFKKIRKMFPEKIKVTGSEAYSNEDVRTMLEYAKKPRLKAEIHILASTGCRIGALSELQIKHVRDMEDCKAIQFYPDSKSEYWGFLTPEAGKALNVYITKRQNDGEIITPNSPLLRKAYRFGRAKAFPVGTDGLQREIMKVAKLIKREKRGFRYNKQVDHGFRKRFDTILKNNRATNLSLAEKLMSHSTKTIPLDTTYHSPDLITLFDEFKKHMPNLTIDPTERLKVEKERLQGELSEKDILKQELKNQRQEIDNLKELHHQHVSLIKAIREDPEFAKGLRDALLTMKSEEGKISVY